MDRKPRPNHRAYIEALRRMSPEQRAEKAFELSEFTKQSFLSGLRERFPHLAEPDLRQLYLKRVARCHNQNY